MLVQCNQSVIVHAGKGKLYYCCAVETDSVLLVCMLFLENLKVSRTSLFFFSCLSVERQDRRPDFFQMLVQWNQSVNVHNRKGKLYYCCAIETDSVRLVCMLFLENP